MASADPAFAPDSSKTACSKIGKICKGYKQIVILVPKLSHGLYRIRTRFAKSIVAEEIPHERDFADWES